jgi:hypothetical protein
VQIKLYLQQKCESRHVRLSSTQDFPTELR